MLEECVNQPDEPFRRSEMVGWFRRHYPDVKETIVAAHIYAATANAVNRAENHPVDHGLYVRAAARLTGRLAAAGRWLALLSPMTSRCPQEPPAGLARTTTRRGFGRAGVS